MRLVVTGAAGFLGSHVVRRALQATTYKVAAVSSQPRTRVIAGMEMEPWYETLSDGRLEVFSNEALLGPDLLSESDVVIGCAFPWNRGGEELGRGLAYMQRLFQRAKNNRVKTFVNVSSQSVYNSERNRPALESDPVDCSSPYATGKVAAELLAGSILSEGTFVNARLASLIGVGYEIRIVNRFINKALRGEPIEIIGGGQCLDYMDVRDAAAALIEVASQGWRPGTEVLNVGAEKPLKLLEIATIIAESVQHETGAVADIIIESDPNQRGTNSLDCSLLAETYGFRARIPMRKTVKWILDDAALSANPS